MNKYKLLALLVVVGVTILIAFVCERVYGAELPVDTDRDGCSNWEETHYRMNPNNPYDFFDVPAKDGVVGAGDIGSVVARFGLTEGSPNYYVGFDRGPGLTKPDGGISASDIGMVVSQFGRVCRETPWCGGYVSDSSETADETLEGARVSTNCYKIVDQSGRVVDYSVVTNEETKEVTGDEPLDQLPVGLPSPQAAQQAVRELGISQPFTTSSGSYIRYWSCDRSKTWRDFFHIPLYRIQIHVDFKELRNAGVYTGAVNVYNSWGDEDAWWPWNLDGDAQMSKVYVYTGTGPWDFKIFVQRDQRIHAGVLGNNIRYKTIHAKWQVGPGASCLWWAWD